MIPSPSFRTSKRKRRSDAVSIEIESAICAQRARGKLVSEIMSEFSLCKKTVLRIVKEVPPPGGAKSWLSFSAKGREITPSEIVHHAPGVLAIKLSGPLGLMALIDENDRSKVEAFRWFPMRSDQAGEVFYARTENKHVGAVFLHNLIMPVPTGLIVDHKNGDPLDNRKDNLRPADKSGNAANKRPCANRSGYVGVSWHEKSKLWHVTVGWKRKVHSGGYFSCPREAALARDLLARQLQGEFAVLNFPEAEQ